MTDSHSRASAQTSQDRQDRQERQEHPPLDLIEGMTISASHASAALRDVGAARKAAAANDSQKCVYYFLAALSKVPDLAETLAPELTDHLKRLSAELVATGLGAQAAWLYAKTCAALPHIPEMADLFHDRGVLLYSVGQEDEASLPTRCTRARVCSSLKPPHLRLCSPVCSPLKPLHLRLCSPVPLPL